MHAKNVCIVVDLRTGQDVEKVPELIAVFEAAGWKTDIALKEYGGETMKLAAKAAEKGYDLVIGYGGDGTMNDVVNGVMKAGKKSIVGDIPGGTANEWAGEIGMPDDPMKAALTLLNSDARTMDLGYVSVHGLTFPNDEQESTESKKTEKKVGKSLKTRQYFVLHAGLGADAALLAHTSKPLKYHFGRLAYDMAAIKELPQQHSFPVEVRAISENGDAVMLWHGQAWQVILSNARRYAGNVDIAPTAYIDDGLLNVLVIPESNILRTLEQAISFLLLHKLDHADNKYFRGTHLSIRVPASIAMQLDGSVVKLKDYLSKSEHNALKQVQDIAQVMVDYRFDAEPGALQMAFPHTYQGTLFEKPTYTEASEQERNEHTHQQHGKQVEEGQQVNPKRVEELRTHGRKVTVVGVAPNPCQKQGYIIAGSYQKKLKDETRPTAICVDDNTTILSSTGKLVAPATVEKLQEGAGIVVEGKKNKRGVIRAKYVIMP